MSKQMALSNGPFTIKLGEDGTAHYMGNGLIVIDQFDDNQPADRRHQRVVVEADDLGLLEPRGSSPIKLDDGVAHYMGDGLWMIDQDDETLSGKARHQRIVLDHDARQALAAMLTTA